MSSPAVLSSLLGSLPPRPPTPPREAHHDTPAPTDKHPLVSVDTRLSVHTPPGLQSPVSALTTSSTSRRKKVGFSGQTEYKDPPDYAEGGAQKQNPTPVSLPRSASKPVKSILKVTNHIPDPLGSTDGVASEAQDTNVNLAVMLESTIQQLAGGDRDSKVDAYLMLTRAWKASNNLPDRVALQEKMSLFTQFMQRDVVARTPEGVLDTSLVNHALNLLNTFLRFPAIASTITNDFGVFILDHCIRSFGDASTPKDIARRLMQVISLQNFSPKVMTSDRVGRLVSSLHNIEEHLSGKSIVLSRVLIYRKLVQQSRQHMVIHSDWLLDMFTDMLSNLRDIRSAAISLGLEAAFSIGHEKLLSRKVMEVFNLSHEDRRYIQYYEEKLKVMIKDKHESAVVPEIWSVVILLLRVPLDKWEYTGPWLHIIQNCFNSPDFPTKIAANHAWCRLVYLIHLDDRAMSKNLSTLTTPLVSQLRRKGSGKTFEDLRQTVLGGICNLFYYVFKPSLNSTVLDSCWDNTVKRVMANMLDPKAEAAGDNLRQASVMLRGLFDCGTPRRWRVDHIVETPLVRPEELPAIDAKWIRRNITRVFAVVEPILAQDFPALARSDSHVYCLWQALVSTVASAAAKEIKISKDTALFVAEALNVLHKIWRRGPRSCGEAETNVVDFLSAVRSYLEVMIRSLGLLPFTEKAGKAQGPAKASVYSLFLMLSTLPPGVSDDEAFSDFFGSVFAPFFTSKGDKARRDLAEDLLSAVPMDTPRPYGSWRLVAEHILNWLEPNQHSNQSNGSAYDTPIGHNYRDIVRVLERGIRSTPNLPRKDWESLFYAVFERVREETGDAGAAILIIEPLAKVLVEQFTSQPAVTISAKSVRYVTDLVSAATQPRDRQAVDAARKRLWGTALAGSRSSSFDTFDNLYRAISEALNYLYNNFDSANADLSIHLLNEISSFFDRCNSQLFLRAMLALQDGFLPWFRDSKRLLASQTGQVFTAMKSLWDKLRHLILDIEQPEQQLQALERFFRASFASCHRYIVSSSVSLWNRLFEDIEYLDYPEELKTALLQMRLHAEIVLPGLETPSSEHAAQQPLFVDSFEDLSLPGLPSTRSSSRRGTPRPASSHSGSPAALKLAVPSRRVPGRSLGQGSVVNNRPAPRVRHDDSQVQFAAIESSPSLGSPVESQVLTERQKEVRERQRENTGLFPEIRSSPGVKPEESGPSETRAQQAATPEPEGEFDDYVSSTPTPRRGQPIMLPPHDMTDPPSSPPELRGNPLAAEIRSRSASHSLLEEWQFSSSPVSGSPNRSGSNVVPDPSSRLGYVSVVSLPEVEDAPRLPSNPVNACDGAEPQPATDEVIEDSFLMVSRMEITRAPESPASPVEQGPSTPRRSPRLPQSQVEETPTPKSGREEFVDAPTSPLPPTPKRSHEITKTTTPSEPVPAEGTVAGNTSFDISDMDDGSLLKLVVELDAGKVNPLEYHRSSASPDGKSQVTPPSLDCIVVAESPTRAEEHGVSKRTRTTPVPSEKPGNAPSSQSKSRRSSKRKRAASKVHDTSSQKRQRKDSAEKADQTALGQLPEQAQTARLDDAKEEAPEERIPSSSAEQSSVESSGPSEVGSQQNLTGSKYGEIMEVEADDQEVQCQIALESFSHNPRQEEYGKSAGAVRSLTEESMQVDVQQPMPNEVEGEAKSTENLLEAHDSAVAKTNHIENIMDLLRKGFDELRSARLSREEVYQVEDMFMDMKRELYEAERRGRT